MRARDFRVIAPMIVLVQVGAIAAWFISEDVQRLLGSGGLVVGAGVLALSIYAWSLMPSAKKTRWPPRRAWTRARKPPKASPKPNAKPVAAPPLAIAPANAPSGWGRSKQAIAGFVEVSKTLFAAARSVFGEKWVTSVCLAAGASLGIPSASILTMLDVAGVNQKIDPKRVDALEKGLAAIRERSDAQQAEIRAVVLSLSRVEHSEAALGTRVWRMEDVMIRSPGGKIHVELFDRRPPVETAGRTDPDIALLLGRAISATSSYWKGHYCEAAKKITSVTATIKPLSPTLANFKGYWHWRLGDLVGAEKCFAHSYRAAIASNVGKGDQTALRQSLMGWAQTYCMRRNYAEVYASNRFQKFQSYFAQRGVVGESTNDQYLAETVLALGLKRDAGFKQELDGQLKAQTEFGRLCSLAIQSVLQPNYKPRDDVEKLLTLRAIELHSGAPSCAMHEPLDCEQRAGP